MKALIQRVRKGAVVVDSEILGQIGTGLVILLGIKISDTPSDVRYLAEKCANLRIFPDADGKFNLSCLDVKGGVLVISQFTLYGNTQKGRRPSFVEAAPPEIAEPLYEQFIEEMQQIGLSVKSGRFGAMMQVEIINDGPVTLMVESKS